MKKTGLVLVLTMALGCSTRSKKTNDDAHVGDQILSSSDASLELPSWAYIEPRYIKDGHLFVSGNVDISVDQSPSRGLDAAAMVARINLSSEIRSRLEGQFQYASEGLEYDRHRLEMMSKNLPMDSLKKPKGKISK